MRKLMYLMTLIVTIGSLGNLDAAIIGVSFDNNTTPIGMLPADQAGAPGVRVGNWNNWAKNDYTMGDTGQTVIDDNGATVPGFTASITPQTARWASRDNNHGNDLELFSDVFDVWGGVYTISVSGIPYAAYDVYVYIRDDGATRGGSFVIGTTTYYTRGGKGNPLGDGTGYFLSSDTTLGAGTDVDQGNYVRFSSISGSSFSLAMDTVNAGDATMRNKVVGFQIVESKIAPTAPLPGAVNVGINQDLQWVVNKPSIAYIDLYLGTQNDPNLSAIPANKKLSMAPATTTTWDTGTLAYSTKYYWRIDYYEPNTAPGATDYLKTNGSVWSFTTAAQAADISAVNPALTVVTAGGSAELSVTGVSVTSYKWYKIGSPDVQLTNGAKYSGVTTNTLTINNVQLADEGYYYCIGSNSLPSSASNRDTGPGRVMTKRLVIHYPLDSTYTGADANEYTADVVSGYDMKLMSADTGTDLPSLVTGVPELGGNGLFFNNSNIADPNHAWGQYASAGDVDMEAMGDGLTIELWVKRLINSSNSNSILSRRTEWSATGMVWQVEYSTSNNGVTLWRHSAPQYPGAPFDPNVWTYVVTTFDKAATTAKVYVNGELESSSTNFTLGPATDSPFKMGCSQATGSSISDPFYGALDDVKIYNYARTSAQIAQDYLAVKGDWVCNNELPKLPYDYNGDCQVNLADFVIFAATWLDNNRIYKQ